VLVVRFVVVLVFASTFFGGLQLGQALREPASGDAGGAATSP
jgi:hypothetical protein